MLPTLHYPWIGKPVSGDRKGQELLGALLFSKKHSNLPIRFWCLEKYAEHYRKIFNSFPNITVEPVEPFVKEKDPLLHDFILALLKSADEADSEHDRARELVTIKELMQYFLATQDEGYMCDTTVIPDERFNSPPKTYEQFRYPHIHVKDRDPSSGPSHFPDPWLIYSPESDPHAEHRYHFYLKGALKEFEDRKGPIVTKGHPFERSLGQFPDPDKVFQEEADPGAKPHEIKRWVLGRIFVYAAQYSPNAKPMITHIEAKRFSAVPIDDCFAKIYMNTHRLFAQYLPPIVHRALHAGSFPELVKLVLALTHPNVSKPYQYSDIEMVYHETTLLHEAVRTHDASIVRAVLAKAKKLNPTVSDLSVMFPVFTPLMLAMKEKSKESIPLFLNAMIQRDYDGDVNAFMRLLSIIYQQLSTKSLPKKINIEELSERLLGEDDMLLLQKAMILLDQFGPLSIDNLDDYVDDLKQAYYQASQLDQSSPKDLKQYKGYCLDRDLVRENLLKIIEIPKSKL